MEKFLQQTSPTVCPLQLLTETHFPLPSAIASWLTEQPSSRLTLLQVTESSTSSIRSSHQHQHQTIFHVLHNALASTTLSWLQSSKQSCWKPSRATDRLRSLRRPTKHLQMQALTSHRLIPLKERQPLLTSCFTTSSPAQFLLRQSQSA